MEALHTQIVKNHTKTQTCDISSNIFQSNASNQLSLILTDTTQVEVEGILRKTKATSCALDRFPLALIKSNPCAVSPMLAKLINLSLQDSHVPMALKCAIIKPLLKNLVQIQKLRPTISNLPFFSKPLETVVAARLHSHISYNSLYETFQSGFHSGLCQQSPADVS